MSALVIGGIVFACVFAGALFGMFLGTVLPKDHLSPDARDVIKVAMSGVDPETADSAVEQVLSAYKDCVRVLGRDLLTEVKSLMQASQQGM
jgi:hypothetical protein